MVASVGEEQFRSPSIAAVGPMTRVCPEKFKLPATLPLKFSTLPARYASCAICVSEVITTCAPAARSSPPTVPLRFTLLPATRTSSARMPVRLTALPAAMMSPFTLPEMDTELPTANRSPPTPPETETLLPARYAFCVTGCTADTDTVSPACQYAPRVSAGTNKPAIASEKINFFMIPILYHLRPCLEKSFKRDLFINITMPNPIRFQTGISEHLPCKKLEPKIWEGTNWPDQIEDLHLYTQSIGFEACVTYQRLVINPEIPRRQLQLWAR